jgi:O-methyltransferase involved in polyketide biosynthesis
LLLTLAARAAGLPDLPAFADPEARRIAAALPVDLQAYAADAAFVRSVVLRSLLFDRLTAEFLTAHPSGLCIALGAGLCTRRSRMGALAEGARWLNVDLPQATALREQYIGGNESHLARSILDTTWLDAAGLPGSQPVLVLLEGVCPYLPQEPLQTMLRQLADRFAPPGSPACTVVLDHVHPLLARLPMQVGGMRLPVVSGFENSAQIAGLHPSVRVSFEEHPYAQFSQQHQLFEAAFHATTGQQPYAVVRLELGATAHG